MDRWRTRFIWVALIIGLVAGILVIFAPLVPQWGEHHEPHVRERFQELRVGQEIRQTFTFEYPRVDGIALWLDATRIQNLTGYIRIEVQAKERAQATVVPLSEVAIDGLLYVPLPVPISAWAGQAGVFAITLHDSDAPLYFRYQIDATKFAAGEMAHSHRAVQGDLAFHMHYLRPALGTWLYHIGYGVAILVAVVVVGYALKREWWGAWHLALADVWVACLLGVVVTLSYAFFLVRPTIWIGPGDFSKDVGYLQATSQAVSQGAWPVWSHLMCGGMPLLANPESNVLSFGSLLGVVVPAEVSLLLMLSLEAGIGAVGMYILARSWAVSPLGSVAAAVVAILAGAYPYRIVQGFSMIGAAVAFVPWVLLGWTQAWRKQGVGWAVVAGMAMTLMFWRGEVHILAGVLVLGAGLAIVQAVWKRSFIPLVWLGISMAIFFLAGSAKLLAYMEEPGFFAQDYRPYVAPLISEGLVDDVFLQTHSRLHPVDVRHGKFAEEWGNFGAYVGWLPIVLLIIGFWKRDKDWLILGSGLVLALVLMEGTLFDVVLRHMGPLAGLFRMPTRLVVLVLTIGGVMVGVGLDRIRVAVTGYRGLVMVVGLLGFIVIDLWLVQRHIFGEQLATRVSVEQVLETRPVLAFHRNAGIDDARHPSVLLHQGYMLPKLCADVLAEPLFVADEVGETVPLSSTPARVIPQGLVLGHVEPGSIVSLNERFLSRWVASQGIVRSGAKGEITLYMPKGVSGGVKLTFVDALTRPQQLLAIFGMLMIGLILADSRPRRRS